jgi:hypothetical protein
VLAAIAAVSMAATNALSACHDYIDPGTPVDAAGDVIEVLDEDAAPPLPTPEAGGEPPRRDATVAPPQDGGADARDATTGG